MVTRKDLVKEIAPEVGLPKGVVDQVIRHLESAIIQELSVGGDVVLGEVGKFSVAHREARVARNPLTGKEVEVPAKLVVKFKPSKKLREEVN